VMNGDCTIPGIRGTGVAEEVVPWRDALHEGPAPDVSDDRLRRVRATFLTGSERRRQGTLAEFAHRDLTLDLYQTAMPSGTGFYSTSDGRYVCLSTSPAPGRYEAS
jgi:hypothetical protein